MLITPLQLEIVFLAALVVLPHILMATKAVLVLLLKQAAPLLKQVLQARRAKSISTVATQIS